MVFDSKNSRSRESSRLLTWALRNFDTIEIAEKNIPIDTLEVWLGKKPRVDVVVNEDIYLTIPKRKKKSIKVVIEYTNPLPAPILKGDKVGLMNVYMKDELKKTFEVFSNENIKQSNVFSRLLKSLNFLVWGDV